ncbi:TPA: hypothetical protein ACH3X1_008725 [Trebouxia sp. C0004]
MQGVSANTSSFHSLSYKAGSTHIHGLVPASHSLNEADLYLDAQRHSPLHGSAASSIRLSALISATQAPVDAVMPSRMRCSRSVTIHANPLWTDADQQSTALAHQPEPHVEQAQLVLACQHTADGPQGADGQPHLQVPHMTAQHRPVPESPTPQQMPQLSLQQAELSDKMYGGSKQHVSSCVSEQFRSSQTSGSPQSARSSQSDATHLDQLDGYMPERHWQESQQQSAAGLSPFDDADLPSKSGCLPSDHEAALRERAERWVNNQMLAHGAAGTRYSESEASLSGYSVSTNPLAWSAEDEQSPRTIPEAVTSMPQKASQLLNSPDKVLKHMAEPADARQAVQQHRQLADNTNTCEARRMAPAKAVGLRLCSQGCTAATVGDMVTFWEQRARAPLHTSCPH